MAYNSPADELFFGGAAGAGKSALGVGLAITQHHRSLILRREAKQVKEIVDQIIKFVGSSKNWRGSGDGGTMYLDNGRTVEISGCKDEKEKEKYQGRPHDLIDFDEAVHFTQSQVRFISGWNRHESPKQRCRVLLGSNPPTNPEGRWIIEEFAPWLDNEYPNPARPGELRWFTYLDGKLTWVDGPGEFEHTDKRTGQVEIIKPRSRTFIPGRLKDNPILSATDYGARLQAMPEPLRSQMLYGDFNAGLEDDAWQIIPTSWIREAMKRWNALPPDCPITDLGVDVARGGSNKTVIAKKRVTWFAPLKKYEGAQTPDGPAVATLVINEYAPDAVVKIDVIGVGSSAYDYLKEHPHIEVIPVNNSNPSKWRSRAKLEFVNVRAASYWKLREDLDPSGPIKLALPPDNEMLADLCAPRYKSMSSGIQVEKKEDIIERIGRSPDCGDAVVLCNWESGNKPKPMRVRGFGARFKSDNKKQLRMVVLSRDELANFSEPETPCLLVSICDPTREKANERSPEKNGAFGGRLETLALGLEGSRNDNERSIEVGGRPCDANGSGVDGNGVHPHHGIHRLVDTLILPFADIDSSEHQRRIGLGECKWEDELPQYGMTVAEVLMKMEQGRELWRFVNKSRDPRPEVILIQDEGGTDRRALSVAFALCDIMRLQRSSTIWRPGLPEWKAGQKDVAPNKHVFETIKGTRS